MRPHLSLALILLSVSVQARSLSVSGPVKTAPVSFGVAPVVQLPVFSAPTLPAAALPGLIAPVLALPAAPAALLRGAAKAAAPSVAKAPEARPAVSVSAQVHAFAASVERGAAFVPAASARLFDGEMKRPVVESWTVEGKTYSSTAELVKALPRSAGPVGAVYTFSDGKKPAPPRPAANAAIGGVSGFVFGTLVMFVAGTLLSALGEIASILTFNPQGGIALGDLGIIGLFGGALGMIVGASSLFKASKAASVAEKSRGGRIFRQAGPEGETILFETGRSLVDLGKFAQAPAVTNPAAPAPWPAWKRALTGLGLGAAAAAAYFIPLLNVAAFFMVPAAVAAVFGAKTAGAGLQGGMLGGALGVLLTVGTIAAQVNVQPWFLSLAGVAAVLGVLGIVLGLWGANAWRAEDAASKALEPSGQWWTEAKRE